MDHVDTLSAIFILICALDARSADGIKIYRAAALYDRLEPVLNMQGCSLDYY